MNRLIILPRYQRVKRAALFGAVAFLVGPLAVEAATRVALMNLICEDNSYRSTLAAEDFTATLQAQVAAETAFEWVERSELSRVESEFKLSHIGLIDRFEALRNGHWLRGDWAVLGRIATNTANARAVSLEIVDLQHAETLAQSTVTITAAAVPLRVVSADVARVAEALQALLKEADRKHKGQQGKTAVGMLFLAGQNRGASYTNLVSEFISAVETNQPTVRFIQFQRAGEAMDEADLVLSGLAQTDRNAWEKVADMYLWGSYKVESNRRLNRQTRQRQNQQIVMLSLNIWDGRSEPQAITLSFTNSPSVSDLASNLAVSLSPKLHRLAEGLGSESVRRKVSTSLAARVLEQAASGPNAFLISTEGRQQWMELVQMLETACFFDPGHHEARELWLRVRWGRRAMAASPKEFFFARRRSEAWRKHVEEFGFNSKCPPPVKSWWEVDSVASEFVLSAWRTYEMFGFSQHDLARWGIPYDTGGPELLAWRRQFGEDLYARFVTAPEDAKVLAHAHELFYGALAMNRDEFVLRDARQRQRILNQLWPHVLERQRKEPAAFDAAHLRGLRMHFEQIGQRGGERVWLEQLDQIARSDREKERAQPIQLPRANSPGTENPQPKPKP